MKSTTKQTRRRRCAALALLGVAVAGPVWAGERIAATDLRGALSGVTLDGIYRDGSFFSETYGEDGSIRYHDSEGADSGEWSIKGETFCTFYQSLEGACFFVERDGTNCFTFFAAAEASDGSVKPEADWTSRGWARGKPSTCPTQPEVSI